MQNEQFEIGDVVEWNPDESSVYGLSLLERVKKYGYSHGPFLVTQITESVVIVTSLDGSKLLEYNQPIRTDYNILFCNAKKNVFLTAARKAVQNA